MFKTLRDQIIEWLQDNVSAKRLRHILGVEALSVALAQQYQLNPTQAAQAGLMHDLAKFFKPQQLLAIAQKELGEIDPICRAKPHLLHADVGAIVAQQEFGVTDATILDAIRHHTLGAPQMAPLSCVVFIADAIEPSRGDGSDLEALRRLSRRNLHHCVQRTCDYKMQHLLRKEQTIHPRMVLTRNWALQKAREHLVVKSTRSEASSQG